MTRRTRTRTRRFACTAAFAVLAALTIVGARPGDVLAARLFTVVSGTGLICEIDPIAATEIFSFNTPGTGVHTGLAFDGTELFYTDETLGVVNVYLPDGTFVRDLPKPGPEVDAGAGLGVSPTSLWGVDVGDSTITAINPLDGSPQTSFYVAGAKSGLTYAGARGTLFVRIGDGQTISEVASDGAVVNTFAVPVNLSGLAYSSSLQRLFGVVAGKLYAFDPDSGALLAGYPIQITGGEGYRVQKSGAAAADEIESCGDGVVNEGEQCDDGNLVDGDGCTGECTPEICGDGVVQQALGESCEPPNTPTCNADCKTREVCDDFVDNDGDQLVDCLDVVDCQCPPVGRDPGVIRFGRFGEPGRDYLSVHGRIEPTTAMSPSQEKIGLRLSNANGLVVELVLPAGAMSTKGRLRYRYRNNAIKAAGQGFARVDVRSYPRLGHYRFLVRAHGDLSAATLARMSLQVTIGNDSFLNQSDWLPTGSGWKLVLPGE